MSSKRIFDIIFALAGLLLFSPMLLLIMALILFEDGRPAIFIQERIGRDFRPFGCMKFRSMRDGRITRVGHWIRRTGLDELLQFVNVLQGSMSMVGPRPLTPQDAARLGLDDGRLPRFTLRPGITGMAQLYAGRGIRVTRYLERSYMERRSIRLDSIILLLSLLVNIFGKQRVRYGLNLLRQARRRSRSACGGRLKLLWSLI